MEGRTKFPYGRERDFNNILGLGGKNKVMTKCLWEGSSESPNKAACTGRLVMTEKGLQK